MLVCVCKGVTDRDIENAIHDGAKGIGEVRARLGVGSCCGQCGPYAKDLVKETIARQRAEQQYDLAYAAACL